MEKETRDKPQVKKKDARREDIVRIRQTNLDGTRPLSSALLGVKGVSFALSDAISKISGLGGKKVAELSAEEIKKVEDMIESPQKYGMPSWMYNRRKDLDTGKDVHLSVSDLELRKKFDIDKEKKIKSYRGVRHILQLPVRGQRTRGSFRKGSIVGVSKKKAQQQSSKKSSK